jgi:hypothetical protein
MLWFTYGLGLMLTILLFTSLTAGESDLMFPFIEGKALTGERFIVPDSLAKANNVILVAFLREQQEDIDTWLPRLEAIEDEHGDIAVYEFPVLPEMNRVTRWFIYRGMRGGITSERARARTITFHLDKEEFREALQIADEDSIQVFLTDVAGKVLWRDSGVWSEVKQSDMMKFLPAPDEPDAGSESAEP